jgi:predicted nucleic acid-binding protein
VLYLDSSAIVKLIVREEESDALRELLQIKAEQVTSVIAAVEVPVAVRRNEEPDEAVERAKSLLEAIDLRPLDDEVVERARTGPATRALDAIHLATALTIGDDLEAIVTYDLRLRDAASARGITVLAPSEVEVV